MILESPSLLACNLFSCSLTSNRRVALRVCRGLCRRLLLDGDGLVGVGDTLVFGWWILARVSSSGAGSCLAPWLWALGGPWCYFASLPGCSLSVVAASPCVSPMSVCVTSLLMHLFSFRAITHRAHTIPRQGWRCWLEGEGLCGEGRLCYRNVALSSLATPPPSPALQF